MNVRLQLENEWPHHYQKDPIQNGTINNLYWPVQFCPPDMPTHLLDRSDFYEDRKSGLLFVEVNAQISQGKIVLSTVRYSLEKRDSGVLIPRNVIGTIEIESLAQTVWNSCTSVDSHRENRMPVRRFPQADHSSGVRAYRGALILPLPKRR